MNHFSTRYQTWFLILLVWFNFQSQLSAQNNASIGSWRSYLSLNDAKDIVSDSEQIIAITTGGLALFDESFVLDESFGPIGGLHKALNPTSLLKIATSNEVIIGYQDGIARRNEIQQFLEL